MTSTDFTSQSQEEHSKQPISALQMQMLELLDLPFSKRLAVFKFPDSLGLTHFGFNSLSNKKNLEFVQLDFQKPLNTNQIQIIKKMSEKPYRIVPDRKTVYTLDHSILSMYKLVNSDMDGFFTCFSTI